MTDNIDKIVQEAECVAAADEYFKARTWLMDTTDNRRIFEAGFDRAYALLSKLRAEGVQAGDERALFEWHNRACELTHDEDVPDEYRNSHVQECWNGWKDRAALASAEETRPAARVAGDDASRYLEWDKNRSAWEMPVGTPLFYGNRSPVADESPMAKMADALREKGRQEQQAYQDSRVQSTEWGPMPHGTEADLPASAPVADVKDWRIDTSAGGPILVYKDCSVIESEQAEYVLRLIAADQASAPIAGEAVAWRALDGHGLPQTEWIDGDPGPDMKSAWVGGHIERAHAATQADRVAGEAREPVGRVRHFNYSGVARNGFSQEAVLNDDAPTLPDGTLLYAAPQASKCECSRKSKAVADSEAEL